VKIEIAFIFMLMMENHILNLNLILDFFVCEYFEIGLMVMASGWDLRVRVQTIDIEYIDHASDQKS